jgi:hypothetical protein
MESKVTDERDAHCEKQRSPICEAEGRMQIEESDFPFEKAESPMDEDENQMRTSLPKEMGN